jgi:hypothetical protein
MIVYDLMITYYWSDGWRQAKMFLSSLEDAKFYAMSHLPIDPTPDLDWFEYPSGKMWSASTKLPCALYSIQEVEVTKDIEFGDVYNEILLGEIE